MTVEDLYIENIDEFVKDEDKIVIFVLLSYFISGCVNFVIQIFLIDICFRDLHFLHILDNDFYSVYLILKAFKFIFLCTEKIF